MGILASSDEGVLLAGVFERTSKTLRKEVDAFSRKLKELQAKLSIPAFITATKWEGNKLHVRVLAASRIAAPRARPRSETLMPATSGGWSPQAKAAREVAAGIRQELGLPKK